MALPAVEKKYENPYGVDATIKTMQIDEIVSEKVRATSNRARYRDFYDLCLLLADDRTDLERSLEHARQKEIRALVSPEEIQNNWKRALEQAEKEKRSMYMKEFVSEQDIQALIASFDFAPIYPPAVE